jgi:hypothetical protein
MWTSKEEVAARELSRKNIQEVRDIVLIDHDKLEKHCETFDSHVLKGEDTVDKIFSKINGLKCPKESTIKVLEDYKREQNGSLKALKEQSLEHKETLNALKNQMMGEDIAKEKRNRKITTYVSIAGVILVVAGLFFQLYDMKKTSLKNNTILEYKMLQLEGKTVE